MTRLLRAILSSFDYPATFENAGVAPEPAPKVDMDAFDRHLDELLAWSQSQPVEGIEIVPS
jgi:hypothetical protein